MSDFYTSKQYSWNDISIIMGGRIIEGVVDIEVEVSRETKVLKGRGMKGHQILKGNHAVKGKIGIWQSEFEAMTESAPDKDPTLMEFDLLWSHVATDGGPTVVDVIKSTSIESFKKGMKQGDTNQIIELPFVALDFKPQI